MSDASLDASIRWNLALKAYAEYRNWQWHEMQPLIPDDANNPEDDASD